MTIAETIRKDRESGAKRLETEYKAELLSFAKRFCCDEAEAEALVYRTFAEVVAGIDGYTEQSAFFGWMCKILVNCHAKDVRRKSNSTIVFTDEVPELPDDGAKRVLMTVDSSILRDAVCRLPKDMKDAVILHYFMDMPLKQIAQILSVPVGTVMSRLHYARITLTMRLGAKLKKPAVAVIAAALLLLGATAAIVSGLRPTGQANQDEESTVVERGALDSPGESSNSVGNGEFDESLDLSTSQPLNSSTTRENVAMKRTTSVRRLFTRFAAALVAVVSPAVAEADVPYICSPTVSANGAEGASVNTGYMLKPTSRIEVDFQFTDAPKDVLFGAWGDTKSDAVPQLRAAFWVSSGTFRFILSDTRLDSRDTTALIDTARHVAVIDVLNHKCWLQDVNGELQGVKIDFPACSNVSDWPISLFAGSRNAAGDGNQHVKARIYSVKIYENDDLVHDLVPCLKGRDAGFYDKKADGFLYGQGKYDLVCGGDGVKTISDDGYLQSSGSQYFNTGYMLKPTSRIEVDFQYPNAATANFLFGTYGDDSGINAFMWNDGNPKRYKFHLKDGAYAGAANLNTGIDCSDTNRFTAVMDIAARTCSMLRNGYERWSGTVASDYTLNNDGTWPLVLFGSAKSAAGDGKSGVSARIYSTRIYEKQQNGTYVLQKEFVPYVKDGAAGFRETQGGAFTAIGGIIAGGNIDSDRCSYVENDGSTVLNLGYKANMASRIEVDYQCMEPSVNSRLIFGAWSGGSLRYTCWNNANLVKFIFHGKSSADPQYADSGYVPDALRHTAILDMKNQHIHYLTGSVTNYSRAANADTFDPGDEAYPMGVFGTISNEAGTGCNSTMTSHTRIYSVRIYENGEPEPKHEFLPYVNGSTVSLYDVKTGHVATKVMSTMAEPTIGGMGVDGAERWLVAPQNVTVGRTRIATLSAAAAGAIKYRWALNGEVIAGETDCELPVAWRYAKKPDVYTVTPIYSVCGVEIEGAPLSAEVTNEPVGLVVTIQ